jgi:hypothetical protein
MRALAFLLIGLSLLPVVENPWPASIGLELPVEAAGVGGVVATVLFAGAPRGRREKATFRGGLWGFYLGALFYLLSLLNQLTLNL